MKWMAMEGLSTGYYSGLESILFTMYVNRSSCSRFLKQGPFGINTGQEHLLQGV